MSLLSKSRSVLILTDEGLQIFFVTSRRSKLVDQINWEDEQFHKKLNHGLIKLCRKSAVVILNDMVEQHYRKENIPKVSFLDKENVIKRRLGVAFPNYPVRAALKLSGKDKNKSKTSGPAYLFSAIPASEAFQKTLFAVREAGVELIGVYLLPVEAASLVSQLSTKLNKSAKSKPDWTIFVGQHHNGNVRQVVTRKGELALTRLTPIVDTDVEPELWAKELSGELDATMSYLARFGYKESDGLDIIIIANESCHNSLEQSVNISSNLHLLSCVEAAKNLGFSVGKQEDYRYADPLHASYLGRKTQFLLPMQAPIIQSTVQPRKVTRYILLGMLLLFSYMFFSTFQTWQKSVTAGDRLTIVVEQNRSVKQELDKELAKVKEMGFDFLLVNNSLEIYKSIQNRKIEPSEIIKEVAASMDADIHLDKISFTPVKDKNKKEDNTYRSLNEVESETVFMEALVTLSFPSTVSAEDGVRKVEKFEGKLQESLPNYQVNVLRQVADLSYTGNFVGGDVSNNVTQANTERYTAEIRIKEIAK